MAGLRPEVREFRDLTRCRWVLTDAAGAFLADHQVRLDASAAEYDMPSYPVPEEVPLNPDGGLALARRIASR
jgi:hypothetical protein